MEKNVNVNSSKGIGICSLLTIIFVIAKIFNLVSFSWLVCFLPLIISIGLAVTLTIIVFIISLIIALIKR